MTSASGLSHLTWAICRMTELVTIPDGRYGLRVRNGTGIDIRRSTGEAYSISFGSRLDRVELVPRNEASCRGC
jgi:hypothetical protein